MKYYDVAAGEWVYPKRRGYKLACCDCGLVHTVNLKLVKKGKRNFILWQFFRDDKATKQLRLQDKNKKAARL